MAAVNPHNSQRVEHYGADVESAQVVVMLVHGRTITPEYMNDNVVKRLSSSDVAFIAPAADGNCWYPKPFMSPLADNMPGIQHTMERLDGLVNGVLGSGIPAERIFWCGFSQGACSVAQYVANNPRRWAGLIALTGGLIGPPETKWLINGSFDGMPAYFSTSESDPHVPEHRVRDSATVFANAGANVSVEFHLGRDHSISDAEISRVQYMFDSVSNK